MDLLAKFLAFIMSLLPFGSKEVTKPNQTLVTPTVVISKIAATVSPQVTVKLSPTKLPENYIKTPSVNVGGEGWTVTARPGESVRITSVTPQKGATVVGVELPSSGAPEGVSFSSDNNPAGANIYLKVSSTAKPGKYSFRQKFKTTFSTGVAPGDLSMGITLTILPK